MGIKQVTTVEALDDLTGEKIPEDTKPTEVTYKGKKHEVYLSEANVKRFEDFLKGDSPLVSKSGTGGIARHGYELADVRTWAIAQKKKGKGGDPIKETTKILHQGIWDAYRDHMESEDA
jgi:hypothetical protein